MKNKILKVHSHPRSGTNFLEAFLQQNFYPNEDLSVTGAWGHWANRQTFTEPVPHGKLFGNHFLPRDRHNPAIYIYRDGRAVALSVWKSQGFLNKEMKEMDFSTYLRTNLDWSCSPSQRVSPYQNIIQHWFTHVTQWSKTPSSVLKIRYEDLVLDPQKTLDQVANFYDLTYCTQFTPLERLVGPSPNAGKISAWKEYFSSEDLEYFHSFVPQDNIFLHKGENR